MLDKRSEAYKKFAQDVSTARIYQWLSVFWQVNEPVLNPDVKSVLEFGVGRGLSKTIMEHYGIRHVGVDAKGTQGGFTPDVTGTIADFEINQTFDMICAFQCLEHNPIEEIDNILKKLYRLSNRYVYISLPYNGRWLSCLINLFVPKLNLRIIKAWPLDRIFKRLKPVTLYRKRPDKYNPHWWEVGDKNMTRKDMRAKFNNLGFKIIKEFHCQTYPHHLFYLLEKTTCRQS